MRGGGRERDAKESFEVSKARRKMATPLGGGRKRTTRSTPARAKGESANRGCSEPLQFLQFDACRPPFSPGPPVFNVDD